MSPADEPRENEQTPAGGDEQGPQEEQISAEASEPAADAPAQAQAEEAPQAEAEAVAEPEPTAQAEDASQPESRAPPVHVGAALRGEILTLPEIGLRL